MQTSPVLNQANLLSTPAPARAADSNASATPFNQMLSRELADRRSAEAPKAPDAGNAPSASAAAPAASPATASGKPQGSKDAHDKKTDDSKDATGAVAADAATQAPADMLALVATLNQAQATPVAADAQDAKAVTEGDPALAALAAKTERSTITPADAKAANAIAADPDGGKARSKPDLALTAADAKGRKVDTDAATTDKPVALNAATKPAADLAAAEHNAAAADASAKPDFAAQIKESLTNASAAMQPVQQAALHAVQPAVVHAPDKLTPAVGTPAWDQALGQKVVWMVAGEQQSASLTLNPPDLGPLQVVLNVTNSNATATFSAAQPEVRQALEAALPKLREMLGDAGIQLGQASVNSGAQNQQAAADQQASHGARRAEPADSRADASIRVGRVQPASSGLGLVDTFA
jgi:flagellar hook-length control protein FliK